MPYEPFLISDLTEGKITRRDAWLLPPDGFGLASSWGEAEIFTVAEFWKR